MFTAVRSSPRHAARRILCLASVAAMVAACGSDEAPGTSPELDGASVAVGNGSASAFVVQGHGGPAQIGVKLTPGALQNLPSSDSMWTLPLPTGVNVPAFDHVMINWNAQGHPPAPYMIPHFDFHFYLITPSAQAAIQAGADTVTVPAQFVPTDYVSGVQAVPDMGVHWLDTLSAELRGQPFTGTFVYGFSKGSMVFLEPMVAQSYLATQPNVVMSVKQPQAWQVPGNYPTSWSIRTDPNSGDIRITLDSLVAR